MIVIKYVETKIVFQEVPDKISLAINISNCQHNCKGCHSPYLRTDTGDELNEESIERLISGNKGINCVVFMGEGNDRESLMNMSRYIHENYKDIQTAVYSGRKEVEDEMYKEFDYVKVGPYREDFGPLNKRTTNQILYKCDKNGNKEDITYRFWT